MPSIHRLFAPICLLILLPVALLAAPLDDEIRALTGTGASGRAHWGVYAVGVQGGSPLADVNSQRLFVPASNRKIVTSALALEYLKADATLQTIVHSVRPPQNGVLDGDLVVTASGDPSWCAELRGGRSGRSILTNLARQVRDAGVERVNGDLVIDTSRFAEPAIMPPGWDWEDLQTIYGSIPSVFGIDKNLAPVIVAPGRAGEPVRIAFNGGATPFELVNESTTGPAGSAPTFQLSRGLDGLQLRATGRIPADAGEARRSMALGRPVQHAAAELRSALEAAGVSVSGNVRIVSEPIREGHALAGISSAPMPQMLTAMNQPSDNYLAESLYLLAGAGRFGRGSYATSAQAEKQLWKRLGVADDEWVAGDGSGLSRRNFVTPRALAVMLIDLHGNAPFVDSLPVSGRSGTLRYRLAENGMTGRVSAKTGTLTGVASLSGYVKADSGRTIVFSILVNNYTSSPFTIRRDIDRIVELIARRG